MFITLEGPDGSGKTTQVPALAEVIRSAGYELIVTREPGGTTIGDATRAVIMDLENIEMHPTTEILLFQASRAQLVNQIIRPALASGTVILCDRYADSTLAYQGHGHQTDMAALKMVVNFATGGLKPDLTLFLDVDAETGLRRRAGDADQWNRLDAYALDFHDRVRAGYDHLMALEPERWVKVDANRPANEVQVELHEIVLERLAAWKK